MAAAVKHVYLAPLNLVFLQCHRVAQYIQIGIVHSPAGHAVQQATAGVSLNALLSSSKSRSVMHPGIGGISRAAARQRRCLLVEEGRHRRILTHADLRSQEVGFVWREIGGI